MNLLRSFTSGSHLRAIVETDARRRRSKMRRGIAIVALVVLILSGIGIAVGAYNAGERNGVTQGIEQVQVAQENGQEVQVVHVVGDEHRIFFPGFFLFPLFLIGTFFLVGGIVRGGGRWGHGGPGGHGPDPWNEEGRRRFEERAREWHRHEHGEAPPAEATVAG
jgi:hypothetical protein